MIPFVSNNNTIKWTFENLNNWNGYSKWSKIVKIGPTKWSIGIKKKNMIDGINYLGIYLTYSGENKLKKNWFCETKKRIKLINQTGQKSNITIADTEIHDHIFRFWGWYQCYNWDNLMEDGYMKDNSIIVEIDISLKYYDFSKISNLTDIILKIGEYEFHTNKGILCYQSEYFYNLFVNKNYQGSVIEVKDVQIADFRQFLASFYPHFDEIDRKNFIFLNKMAMKYKVSVLRENCEKFLMKDTRRSLENKLKYANNYDYHNLMKHCIESLDSVQKIRKIQESYIYFDFKESTKQAIIDRVLELMD
ncbi:unnamed protein product [Caenorhabditis angaria]|uniref:BTB domain-containing protein n=1 Tax=Caenorhabditis angaria TaxID=860376 RepID=A0A9P1I8J3_9PELO|nr:unnamed protein product [Caenorhabditis angaria]